MKVDDLYKTLKCYFENEALPGEEFQYLMAPASRNPMLIEHKSDPSAAAVLLLLYPIGTVWHLALTKRHTYKGSHSGQISFPGGKREDSDTSLQETALRETQEEIGVNCTHSDCVGQLSQLHIPVSNFMVSPYVAIVSGRPEMKKDDHEVKHIIEIPLELILNDKYKSTTEITNDKYHFNTPIYQLEDDYIWGATAMILSEFAEILKRCGIQFTN